ncbi:uncharacterized protein BDR25DRAFT_356258 [Lindgomyces ingoldianus]|uniref:Uncharacterized protein n=1 Tax=Lindgomyces ingoldianus TaxID=673940 RepID=A0ACB6QRI6_9PLEO|nr:uncharacterized protein BDR25DRAFT_356258 [Lindgomyces ingoldianus]KAF2469546.1 hypothetical protein BDR25DRAFT_356258 [Lindgomyces ingoldianus]
MKGAFADLDPHCLSRELFLSNPKSSALNVTLAQECGTARRVQCVDKLMHSWFPGSRILRRNKATYCIMRSRIYLGFNAEGRGQDTCLRFAVATSPFQPARSSSKVVWGFRMQPSLEKVRDACDRCHSKKLKCERFGAKCNRCDQQGLACIFSARRPYDTSKRIRMSRQHSITHTIETPFTPPFAANENIGRGANQVQTWNVDDFNSILSVHTPTELPALLSRSVEANRIWGDDRVFAERSGRGSIVSSSPPAHFRGMDENMIRDDLLSSSRSVINPIADVAIAIFQIIELDNIRLQPDSPILVEVPSGHPDLYAHTFNNSQSLVQVLCTSYIPYDKSDRDKIPDAVDDAEILLVLSCFTKLLARYDKIFTCWLSLIESVLHPQDLFAPVLKDTILQLLPPISIGMFLAPTCHVAQLQLILEVSGNMFQELSQCLERVVASISGRDPMARAGVITHVSDTTAELVMSRERAVRAKKGMLLQRIKDQGVQKKVEVLLSPSEIGRAGITLSGDMLYERRDVLLANLPERLRSENP